MNGWKKSGRGAKVRLVASLEAQEAAVLRGLVAEVKQMLAGRVEQNPADELAAITGIRTGPSREFRARESAVGSSQARVVRVCAIVVSIVSGPLCVCVCL